MQKTDSLVAAMIKVMVTNPELFPIVKIIAEYATVTLNLKGHNIIFYIQETIRQRTGINGVAEHNMRILNDLWWSLPVEEMSKYKKIVLRNALLEFGDLSIKGFHDKINAIELNW